MHGCERACCGQREPRRSAFSDGCGGFRQALGLAVASAHHLTITRMKPAPARCEPIPAFPLLPGPSTCPAWLSAAPVAAGCEPIPAFPLLPARTIAGIRACGTSVGVRNIAVYTREGLSPRRCSDEHFLVKPSTESLCWGSRVSSPQRPTCSRRRPYIPAAVPAQWFRLLISATLILLLSHAGGDYRSQHG